LVFKTHVEYKNIGLKTLGSNHKTETLSA